MKNRTYLAIDLKSFYASVECIERGLDPLTTNLVVADKNRTNKTICLAVSPSLRAYGISARARLFEVVKKVKEINAQRLNKATKGVFNGSSYNDIELKSSPNLSLDYIIATPRMAYYIEYSTRIYNIYLKYISSEDIHVYSIDEVFMDITNYLKTYNISATELATKILLDVLNTTGITATAGIGTNLYLAKVAMDIQAKKVPKNKDGVQIAELDEMSYRKLLWSHRPITDFWRVGKGYAKKLEKQGLYTMGDIARCSIGKPTDYHNEDLLYEMFGINAELLIDHAWGWEPCTIEDIKNYRASSKSITSGQVLQSGYNYEKARLVVWEMTDLLALDLVDKRFVTNQIVLTVGYDIENLKNPKTRKLYEGEITTDSYGRKVPKPAHGTVNLHRHTSSTKLIRDGVMDLFDQIVDKNLLVRRVNISANNLIDELNAPKENNTVQLDFFTDYETIQKEKDMEEELIRERKLQETILELKDKFGKNSILKGRNLEEGATTTDRNKQIGGHKA
ncbi:MAG: DNA methylase [Clostridiales bacterium]|nr:DNA methylase [Clostridiales bacterium]